MSQSQQWLNTTIKSYQRSKPRGIKLRQKKKRKKQKQDKSLLKKAMQGELKNQKKKEKFKGKNQFI